MAFVLADLVQETCNNPGTGTVNLQGAVSGRRSFVDAIGNGNTCFYAISDGTKSEWGVGTVTAGTPNTLARTTCLGNTNGTTDKLNFTGACNVYVAPPIAKQVWQDKDGALQNIPAGSIGYSKLSISDGDIAQSKLARTTEARSSNTILGAADVGKTLLLSSTFAQTLAAAAALGNGWSIYIKNVGAGVITLDPDGSETVDGSTTLLMPPGDGFWLICDGSGFYTAGRPRRVLLGSSVLSSAVASIDFANIFNAACDDYEVDISDLVPATNGTSLRLRVSDDGSTFESGANYWHIRMGAFTVAAGGFNDSNDGSGPQTSGTIVNAMSNNTGRPVNGEVKIRNPAGLKLKYFEGDFTNFDGTNFFRQIQSIMYDVGTALTGFQLFASSGNIAEGTVRVYGITK